MGMVPRNADFESARDKIVKIGRVEQFLLKKDGFIPNNDKLPLLVYQNALELPTSDPASAIEKILKMNGWGSAWRNSIYNFHHYHSTAHEILAVYSGSARVLLGGDSGITLNVHKGDVLIIPAGVAHKNLGSEEQFRVVGAYPEGQNWDMNYGREEEHHKAEENIKQVPFPKTDPIYGADGPLKNFWSK